MLSFELHEGFSGEAPIAGSFAASECDGINAEQDSPSRGQR